MREVKGAKRRRGGVKKKKKKVSGTTASIVRSSINNSSALWRTRLCLPDFLSWFSGSFSKKQAAKTRVSPRVSCSQSCFRRVQDQAQFEPGLHPNGAQTKPRHRPDQIEQYSRLKQTTCRLCTHTSK